MISKSDQASTLQDPLEALIVLIRVYIYYALLAEPSKREEKRMEFGFFHGQPWNFSRANQTEVAGKRFEKCLQRITALIDEVKGKGANKEDLE